MREHYNISIKEYIKLQGRGVTILDLVEALPKFHAEDHAVQPINLCYFLDENDPSDPIFQACFASLDPEDLSEILMYMDWLEEEDELKAEEDEDEEDD